MIEKFTFGSPVKTGAVVENIEKSKSSVLPYGKLEETKGSTTESWSFKWTLQMDKADMVFGLGEAVRGINKRGFKYQSWCSDVPNQSECVASMYGAHNFLLIKGSQTFGVFFDTASRITFDIGFTEINTLTVTTSDTGVNVYFISAERDDAAAADSKLSDVIRQFRTLIGQSYIPPRWAFGLQQSRWGYRTAEDVRKVADGYRKNNLPLDSICMDIDYMEDYKDFTVDKEKFPDLKGLSAELKKEGIKLIPIIDAGVKILDGYDVYEEGVKNDYFCKKEDGKTNYVVGVWPGRCHFPDFMRPEVRRWFGLKYKFLIDQGVEGFWNDMNEPAMFYSEESLKEAFEMIENFKGKNLDIQSFFEFTGAGGSTFNQLKDYKRFYNQVETEDGSIKTYRHDQVHNIYGASMTRSAGEGLAEVSPDRRILIYSRASCIGAHRYGGIWTGDNDARWDHLLMEIKMLPGLNMCGFMYTGADIGGFSEDTTRDLLLRWLALGVFTPLMRNHAAAGTRDKECYAFGDTEEFRSVISLRYALLPYIYSEYVKDALSSSSFIRPLAFDFENDDRACRTEDQLLVGDGIMIAPVYQQNATGRYVYLPEDMTEIVWKDSSVSCVKKLTKGDHYVEVPLDTVVFFVRSGKAVPLAEPAECSEKVTTDNLKLVGEGTSYQLYEDDGYTRNITLEGHVRTISR